MGIASRAPACALHPTCFHDEACEINDTCESRAGPKQEVPISTPFVEPLDAIPLLGLRALATRKRGDSGTARGGSRGIQHAEPPLRTTSRCCLPQRALRRGRVASRRTGRRDRANREAAGGTTADTHTLHFLMYCEPCESQGRQRVARKPLGLRSGKVPNLDLRR